MPDGTGPKPGNSWAQIGKNRAAGTRSKADLYTTPPDATLALLRQEPDIPGPIWEPACGNGRLVEVLRQAGHKVAATDLNDWGFGTPGVDFLSPTVSKGGVRSVVTNPPFDLSFEFVLRALALEGVDFVAMLLRLTWLEGQDRYHDLFSRDPPNRVHVFTWRIAMFPPDREPAPGEKRPGGALTYAWFVWDRRQTYGSTELRWIPPPPGRRPPGLKRVPVLI